MGGRRGLLEAAAAAAAVVGYIMRVFGSIMAATGSSDTKQASVHMARLYY